MNGNNLADDLRGGLAGAAAILPAVLSSGVVLFAPLGGDWLATGVTAAFIAAVLPLLALALFGGSSFHLTCPKTAVAAILAGAAAGLYAGGKGLPAEMVATAIFAAVALSGIIEFLLGATGLGRFVKYVPQPVIAGFLNGLAILVVMSQLPPLLGFEHGLEDLAEGIGQIRPGALALGLFTILVMLASRRLLPQLPAPLVGLAAGSIAHHGAELLLPGADLGRMVSGNTSEGITLALVDFPRLFAASEMTVLLPVIAATALSVALINAIQTLLSASAIDSDTASRHDSARELKAQGAAHLVSGLAGGMTASGTVPYTRAALGAGGGSRRSAILAAGWLALAGLLAGPATAWLPQSVVAGMILVIALAVVDRWTGQLVRGWLITSDPDIRREIGFSLAIVVIVTLLVAFTDLVIGVGTGLALSLLAHLATASRTIVHRAFDGTATRSRVARPMRDLQRLEEGGGALRILSLQGPLFFGATDAVIAAVEAHQDGARLFIIDLGRVTSIDASGAAALAQIDRRLERAGITLLLAGVGRGHSARLLIREAGHTAFEDENRLFPDFDSALSAAEDYLLVRAKRGAMPDSELPLEELDMFSGLGPEAVAIIRKRLTRESYAAGEKLIAEGDASDAIFILAAGRASVIKSLPDGGGIRLATYLPGVVLGEMGVLGDTTRSADIIIDEDAVCYRLTAADFEAICAENPAMALDIVRGLSRELSRRLAATSATLRELER